MEKIKPGCGFPDTPWRMSKSFQMAGLSGMSMTGKTAETPVFMPPEQIVNFKYV